MLPDPLHPAIVHFPIVLMVSLPVVTAAVVWRLHDGAPLRRWGLVILMAALVTASAFVAIRTGEDEEDVVEEVVAEEAIHDHEEAAEAFYLASWIVLGIALVGLVPGTTGRVGRLLALAGSLVLVGFGVRVSDLGGKLVYQHGAAAAYVEGGRSGAGRGDSVEP
jgi:uncharacterized membrane protein